MYILCLQRTVKRLHLSKVKTSKYYDSGCLVVFYLVSLIWGVNLIAKVGEEQLSNCLSICLSVTPSVSQYMYVLYSVHLSRVCLPTIFFSLSVYLSVHQPVFSRLLHLSFHLSLPLSPLPPSLTSPSSLLLPPSSLPSLTLCRMVTCGAGQSCGRSILTSS